jgi:hypothetical protein
MLVKQLKSLLDNLGDFQDLEVQAQHLHHFAEQMMQEGNAPAGTLMAMGVLIEGLHRRQQEEREAFAERFEQFAAAENQAVFKALFKWKPAAA